MSLGVSGTSLRNMALSFVALVAGTSAAFADEADAVAALIDRHFTEYWPSHEITPAAQSSDAEYLRRVWLDLCGRIPTAGQAREFLRDGHRDKRARLVEDLLDRGAFVGHFTRTLRNAWLARQDTERYPTYAAQFDDFLRDRLRKDAPYDQIVRDILTSPMESSAARTSTDSADWTRSLGFFEANERKAELIAAKAARAFLGLRIDCAQCHDHPIGAWKREQFWQFAAFFSNERIEQEPSLTIPELGTQVQAKFLSGESPSWVGECGPDNAQARAVLAEWITSADNPYFAKAAVNRIWAHCFGVGLVEPVDDMSTQHEPGHPQLLNDLAQEFTERGYDLKCLLRGILRSRPYALTSRRSHNSQDDPEGFARMTVKPLTGEQLFDCVIRAAGYGSVGPFEDLHDFTAVRTEFLGRFAATERPIETTPSISQSLTRMNGALTTLATDPATSPLLVVLRDAPHLDDRQRVEALFLATVSRFPSEEESQQLTSFLAACDTEDELASSLADVFWALLNSHEFSVNH